MVAALNLFGVDYSKEEGWSFKWDYFLNPVAPIKDRKEKKYKAQKQADDAAETQYAAETHAKEEEFEKQQIAKTERLTKVKKMWGKIAEGQADIGTAETKSNFNNANNSSMVNRNVGSKNFNNKGATNFGNQTGGLY